MESQARSTAVIEQSFQDIRDTQCQQGEITSCCGPRVYELEDADTYKSFFTINFEERPIKMSLLSLKDSDSGTYDLKLKATLKNWPDVLPVVIPVKVKVLPCTPLTL
jgi:hypothetical protein